MKKPTTSAMFLSFYLFLIIVTQSCSVYKSPVAPEEALNKGRVKVVTTDKKSFRFNSLITENDQIFGIKKLRSDSATLQFNSTKILIPGNRILYVRIKDRSASTILTVATITGVTLLVAIPVISTIILSNNPLDFSGMSLAN